MNFRIIFILTIVAIFGNVHNVSAQVDSVVGQITNSTVESFAGGISGDGRFVVFESTGNLATENPRNTDGNREIFIFDYAQRRTFQITNTTSLRTGATGTFASSTRSWRRTGTATMHNGKSRPTRPVATSLCAPISC